MSRIDGLIDESSVSVKIKVYSSSIHVCILRYFAYTFVHSNSSLHTRRVGQNHINIQIYGVYTVILAVKPTNVRPYTVCIYNYGQPYIHVDVHTPSSHPLYLDTPNTHLEMYAVLLAELITCILKLRVD